MARETFVMRDGELVPKHLAAPIGHSGPYVQSDTMAPIQSMADGQMYDSKSAYRATLKSRGLIEVGNERGAYEQRREYVPQGVGRDLSRAIDQLRDR